LTVTEALSWLEHLLPSRAPRLWESLRPPATDEEIRSLRLAIAPFELPVDYEHLLRWRNGAQPGPGTWWPILDCGPLLSAGEAAKHYRWLVAEAEECQWHRSWLPIVHDAWAQCGVELDGEHRGVIVDGSFPDPAVAVAPSLAAVLHATCEFVANVPDFDRSRRLKPSFDPETKPLLAPVYEPYGPIPAAI
jgi:SMI1 / KNR4 family (SUKH-1)